MRRIQEIKILTLAILILTNVKIKAQTIPELPNVIPLSPHAQTFQKFGDFPVSYYTGVPDISIPVHNITSKDISFPISLSYNSSGIKVNEEASRVGLGWVLNAGGLVSHSIKGANDFYGFHYLNLPTENDLPDLKGINPTSHTIQHNYLFSWYNLCNRLPCGHPEDDRYYVNYDLNNPTVVPFSLPNGLSYEKFITGVSNLTMDPDFGYDFEPDIFTYNFMGFSNKFIVLRNGEVLKEKEDNLKVEYTVNSSIMTTDVASWKITTPDGAIYSFNETEKVKFVDRPQSESHNSSFYLTKIETVNGYVINLNYKKRNMLLGTFSRHQESDDIWQYAKYSSGYYEIKYLDNIEFPGGRVRFEYLLDREDNMLEPRLKSIYIDDSSGSNKEEWRFVQTYFQANATGQDLPSLQQLNLNTDHYYVDALTKGEFTKSWNEKRLRLDEIRHIAPDSEPQVYKMTYNEGMLPTKLSSSVDHWGYYNGASNYRLIPFQLQLESSPNGIPKFIESGYEGVNREANPSYNQAFILQKIVYPTGGETKFTFESNRFKTNNFENDLYKRELMYEKESKSITGSQSQGLNNVPFFSQPFSVAGGSKQFIITLEIELDQYLYSGDPKLEVSVRKNTSDPNPVFFQTLSGVNYLPNPPISENRKITYSTIRFMIPPGNYVFMIGGSLFKQLKSVSAKISGVTIYPEDYLTKNYLGTGSGLRVSNITNYDSNTSLISGKSFKYTTDYFRYDYYSPGFSSGKLMFHPRYMKNKFYQSSDGERGNGYSVGYSSVYVTDRNINNEKNGVTLYEYINKPDKNLNYSFNFGGEDKASDINPPGIEGFKYQENGTLLKESIFIEENQYLKPLQTTEYISEIIEKDIVWGINKSRFTKPTPSSPLAQGDVYIHGSQTNVTRLNFLYPALRQVWIRLDHKRVTNIENDESIRFINSYSYDPTYRYLIKEELKSESEVLKTLEYKYPPDIIGNQVIDKLTETNRIKYPVEIKQTVKGSISQTINEYELFNGLPQLSKVKTNTGLNRAIESRIFYNLYNEYGNPIEIKKDSVALTVYLWGYKGQYPVAKIVNSTYEKVKSVIGQASIDALNSPFVADNYVREVLSTLRNDGRMKDAEISSYTYSTLAGITSMTDPRGITQYFEYDGFQRLQYIKDHSGSILKQYDYYYKNQ